MHEIFADCFVSCSYTKFNYIVIKMEYLTNSNDKSRGQTSNFKMWDPVAFIFIEGCRCCCANQYLLANPYIFHMQPYFLVVYLLFSDCLLPVVCLWCRRRAWKEGGGGFRLQRYPRGPYLTQCASCLGRMRPVWLLWSDLFLLRVGQIWFDLFKLPGIRSFVDRTVVFWPGPGFWPRVFVRCLLGSNVFMKQDLYLNM